MKMIGLHVNGEPIMVAEDAIVCVGRDHGPKRQGQDSAVVLIREDWHPIAAGDTRGDNALHVDESVKEIAAAMGTELCEREPPRTEPEKIIPSPFTAGHGEEFRINLDEYEEAGAKLTDGADARKENA